MPAKNNFQNQDYEEDYSKEDEDDLDPSGEIRTKAYRIRIELIHRLSPQIRTESSKPFRVSVQARPERLQFRASEAVQTETSITRTMGSSFQVQRVIISTDNVITRFTS